MIDREEFSKVLEEIRHLRALLAAERFLHDRLRDRLEQNPWRGDTEAANSYRDYLRRAS